MFNSSTEDPRGNSRERFLSLDPKMFEYSDRKLALAGLTNFFKRVCEAEKIEPDITEKEYQIYTSYKEVLKGFVRGTEIIIPYTKDNKICKEDIKDNNIRGSKTIYAKTDIEEDLYDDNTQIVIYPQESDIENFNMFVEMMQDVVKERVNESNNTEL
jgi:hypothetical protein